VSPELDKLIRDRKKVEALIRRGLTEEEGSAPEEPMLIWRRAATVWEELNELWAAKVAGRRRKNLRDFRRRPRPSALEDSAPISTAASAPSSSARDSSCRAKKSPAWWHRRRKDRVGRLTRLTAGVVSWCSPSHAAACQAVQGERI